MISLWLMLLLCHGISGVPVKRSLSETKQHKTIGHFTPKIPSKKVKHILTTKPPAMKGLPDFKKPIETDEEINRRMEAEIESYHEVKKRIQFLEQHLSKHADFHLIDDQTLVDASHTLEEMKDKIINPLEVNLLAVRGQIKKSKKQLNGEEKAFIKSVLENADAFLKTSKTRLDNMELLEQDWDSEEEAEKIRIATEVKPQKTKQDVVSKVGQSIVEGLEQDEAIGLRSQRLKKIQQIVSDKKAEVHRAKQEKEVHIDIHKIKQELDREKIMDEEPGYAKKIKKAMDASAEQSHKFIDTKLAHGHSTMSESSSQPSWIIVYVLLGLTVMLFLTVIYLLLFRRSIKPWRRNLFKGEEKSNGYSELSEVRGESQTGIVNHWTENSSWSSWNVNSQKLK